MLTIAQTFGAAWLSFIILRFDRDAASDVVYLEYWSDADYLDHEDAVQAYTALGTACKAAVMGHQVESRHMILRIAEEFRRQPG